MGFSRRESWSDPWLYHIPATELTPIQQPCWASAVPVTTAGEARALWLCENPMRRWTQFPPHCLAGESHLITIEKGKGKEKIYTSQHFKYNM